MISFIGGTGKVGIGLALRFALAGEEIAIGSRNFEKAAKVAEKIGATVPKARIRAMENQEAARKGDILFLTVPYTAQKDTLKSLGGALEDKILVSMVNPFKRIKGEFRSMDLAGGSAAEEAQKLIPKAKVVSAFKNVSAEVFLDVSKPLDCDTIVCSDYKGARRVVMELARKLGIRPIDGGKLKNSRYLDAITVLLLNLNSRYKASTCFKIEGL